MFGRMRPISVMLAVLLFAAWGCRHGARQGQSVGSSEPANAAERPVEKEATSGKGDVVEQHWPDGRLRLRKYVKRDRAGRLINHGSYRRWYDNGRMEYQATFIRGQKHGTATRWHRNGRKWMEEQYAGGKRHGTSRTWDQNGVLRKEEHHIDGKPHGTWTTWDENGKIKWQGRFDHGIPQP